MNQHMSDQVAERFVVVGPVVEDRAAVEEDKVRTAWNVADALLCKADAGIEPEKVERALDIELAQDIILGELRNAYDDSPASVAKFLRQSCPGDCGKALEVVKGR